VPVALLLIGLVAATGAGLLVLAIRRAGLRGPAVVAPAAAPAGSIAGMPPLSDPLLAALQGTARFAPTDLVGRGSAAAATGGDGAPLWVRRLDARIQVHPSPDRTGSERHLRDVDLDPYVGTPER